MHLFHILQCIIQNKNVHIFVSNCALWEREHVHYGICEWGQLECLPHRPLARYAKLRVAHAPGMPGTFSPPQRFSDLDMNHGTCVTHVPWCMPGSIFSGFLWSWWRGKRSRNSRRMRNPQFYVSGKRSMTYKHKSRSFETSRNLRIRRLFVGASIVMAISRIRTPYTLKYLFSNLRFLAIF